MSLPFCTACGTLLDLPDRPPVRCVRCKTETDYETLEQQGLQMEVTYEADRETPRWLEEAMQSSASGDAGGSVTEVTSRKAERATVDAECPKCAHERASFYTMQLRSADECQTVFYECLKCEHTWRENN